MFAKLFFHKETLNIIFHIPRNPYVRKCSQGRNGLWRGKAIHSPINYCREKLLYTAAIHKSACTVIKKIEAVLSLEGYLKLFAVFQNSQNILCILIYSTISRGTPNDDLQKPGWETPPYSEHMYFSAHPHTSV